MTEQNEELLPEEIGNAVLSVAVRDQWCFRGDTLEDNLPSYQAIAKAQLAKAKQHYEKKLQRMALNYDTIIKGTEKQVRAEVVEEIKELCIPLDLISSNNKGVALTFQDLEALKGEK